MLGAPVGWTPVVSSNVEAIRWDPATHELYVRFKAKGKWPSTVYKYLGVPEHVAADMLASGSKGRFVHYRLIPNYEAVGPL